MTHNWTSQFEAYPAAMDFGSVTNLALRKIKAAFGERFSEDHYLDELVGAECYHLLGKCTVVEVVDEAPSTNLIEGAVQQYGGLYYDNGVTMDGATPGDHSDLINADAVDHPQYIERDAVAGFVEVTGAINFSGVNELTGMQETFAAPDSKEAMSRGQHIGVAGAGGSKHLDDSFEMPIGSSFGYGQFDVLNSTVSHDVVVDNYVNFAFVDYCFLPMVTSGQLIWLGCNRVDSDDYIGRFSCEAVDGAHTAAFKYYYLGS